MQWVLVFAVHPVAAAAAAAAASVLAWMGPLVVERKTWWSKETKEANGGGLLCDQVNRERRSVQVPTAPIEC